MNRRNFLGILAAAPAAAVLAPKVLAESPEPATMPKKAWIFNKCYTFNLDGSVATVHSRNAQGIWVDNPVPRHIDIYIPRETLHERGPDGALRPVPFPP